MAFVTTTTASGIRPVLSAGRALNGPPGNVAAPAIVTPPSGMLFDYMTADGGAKAQFPLTNNQFENLTLQINGRYRDWNATLNNPQHRYGGVRAQPTWITQLFQNHNIDGQWITSTAYPSWQPAFRRVFRAYRKGASGQALRTLVFECEHNTARVPVGDTVWFYMGTDWPGGATADASVNLGGFSLPMKQKMACSGGAGAAETPIDSRSTVEVTFNQDLPAINWTSPTFQIADWSPPEPRLHLVHHSFYADAATKAMRHPLGWHRDVLKFDVLRNGGHVVIGGLQDIPTWRCWTKKMNMIDRTLIAELYRMEQQGLAAEYGDTDPRKLANELENEPVEDWTMAAPNIGFRDSLLNYLYPISRSAWGAERTLILKGSGFGSIDNLYSEWDLSNDTHFGTGLNLLGNHNYTDQAHVEGLNGGRQLWYDDFADCQLHASRLSDKVSAGAFKGGIVTEWSALNAYETALRGRMIGKFHTAMYRRGIPVTYWDLVGDAYAFSWLSETVPGAVGKLVQAVDEPLRPFCGRAERSS